MTCLIGMLPVVVWTLTRGVSAVSLSVSGLSPRSELARSLS